MIKTLLKNLILLIAIAYLIGNMYLNEGLKGYKQIFPGKVSTPIFFSIIFDKSTIATCYTYKFSKFIVVDFLKYKELSMYQKEVLILHELGHCEFQRTHNDLRFNNTCPQSLMSTYIFSRLESKLCYNDFKNYYLGELKYGK